MVELRIEPGRPLGLCLRIVTLPEAGEVTQPAGSQELQFWFNGDTPRAQPLGMVPRAPWYLSRG